MSGHVTIREVEDGRTLASFLRVPFTVHADDPAWVPPLFVDRRRALDRNRNPFFAHAEAAYWIAERNGVPLGRVTAQIDRLAPAGQGHFGMLCAPRDPAMIAALMETAEDWLRRRSADTVVGPFNLSINQESGLLVDGFETPPMLLMGHDRPYLAPELERLGYGKAKDLHAYLCKTGGNLPAQVEAMLARGLSERLRLRPLNMRAYTSEIRVLTDIFNDAWSGNWGFVPFTEAEVEAMAREMRLLIDPRLVWFVEVDGEPAAFGACLPNLNEAIRDLGGRLLPFGWAKLLWRLKVRGPRTARVPLMGVRRALSGTMLGSLVPFLIMDAIGRETRRRGMTAVELSWILEDNGPIIRLIEAVGGRRYKTYRLFGKTL